MHAHATLLMSVTTRQQTLLFGINVRGVKHLGLSLSVTTFIKGYPYKNSKWKSPLWGHYMGIFMDSRGFSHSFHGIVIGPMGYKPL